MPEELVNPMTTCAMCSRRFKSKVIPLETKCQDCCLIDLANEQFPGTGMELRCQMHRLVEYIDLLAKTNDRVLNGTVDRHHYICCFLAGRFQLSQPGHTDFPIWLSRVVEGRLTDLDNGEARPDEV